MTAEHDYLKHLAQLQTATWPAGVPREPWYPFGDATMGDVLRGWAARQPDKAAVVFYGRTITYAELDAWSDRCAALLAAHGVRQGDPVAVFLQNCPQFMVVFFAVMKLGAVHVPVNPMFRALELTYELNDSGARVLVALDQLHPLVREVQAQTKVATVFTTSLRDMLPDAPDLPLPPMMETPKQACAGAIDLMAALETVTAAPPRPAIDLDALAALNYTGGTTGMPKGCVHTQRDMLYTCATGTTASASLETDDITVCFMPQFWIAGEDMALLFPVYAGATLVLLTRWDPVCWMAAVDRYKVTHAYVLVDNATEVMEHPDLGKYDLRSLRKSKCTSFVKKLNPAVRAQWRALTGATMHEISWGMTETHTFDTFTTGMDADDWDLKQQPTFVGLPVPGTQFKICDFETGALMPLDEHGEICVRTPSLLKAYWNKDSTTAESLRDGWLHTGDIGVLDGNGCLHFLGRRKEMLKVRGMSVFPGEVETLLAQHPAVLGSGIVGRLDDERGEMPVAFVQLRDTHAGTVSEAELAAWCRENMAAYKVPEVRFLAALPLTATGKVAKEELRKMVSA